jgi:hypothetical protein
LEVATHLFGWLSEGAVGGDEAPEDGERRHVSDGVVLVLQVVRVVRMVGVVRVVVHHVVQRLVVDAGGGRGGRGRRVERLRRRPRRDGDVRRLRRHGDHLVQRIPRGQQPAGRVHRVLHLDKSLDSATTDDSRMKGACPARRTTAAALTAVDRIGSPHEATLTE